MKTIISRSRTILQFSLLSLAITVVTAVAAGLMLNHQAREAMIRSHVSVYPLVVEKILDLHPMLREQLAAKDAERLRWDAMVLKQELQTLGPVVSVRLWGGDGTLLWSDREPMDGGKSGRQLDAARQGAVAYAMEQPLTETLAGNVNPGTILDISIPVTREGRIAGVVELSERDEELAAGIGMQIRRTWWTITGFGGIIFLSLFVVAARANSSLNQAVNKVEQTQQVTIMALAYQAELRDAETGRHIERTSHYVRIMAEGIRKSGRYPGYLRGTYINDIARSAPLHDIGKVAIPDSILRKPGKLTNEEFDVIKQHCVYGVKVLDEAHEKLPFQTFLELARQLILHHHERWDGAGYPAGLKGEAIPLSGRIMAIADVYDALRTKRPYKEPLSHERCVEIIRLESGKQFDPEVVRVFLSVEPKFKTISDEMNDEPALA